MSHFVVAAAAQTVLTGPTDWAPLALAGTSFDSNCFQIRPLQDLAQADLNLALPPKPRQLAQITQFAHHWGLHSQLLG